MNPFADGLLANLLAHSFSAALLPTDHLTNTASVTREFAGQTQDARKTVLVTTALPAFTRHALAAPTTRLASFSVASTPTASTNTTAATATQLTLVAFASADATEATTPSPAATVTPAMTAMTSQEVACPSPDEPSPETKVLAMQTLNALATNTVPSTTETEIATNKQPHLANTAEQFALHPVVPHTATAMPFLSLRDSPTFTEISCFAQSHQSPASHPPPMLTKFLTSEVSVLSESHTLFCLSFTFAMLAHC